MSAPYYRTPEELKIARRYEELVERYHDLPFSAREGSEIDKELEVVSAQYAAIRSMYLCEGGMPVRVRKGLRLKNLAERQAATLYHRIRPMLAGDEINATTDLIPHLTYPAKVVIGGTEIRGSEWFEAAYGDRLPRPIGKPSDMEFKRIPKREWSDWIEAEQAPTMLDFVHWVLDQNGTGSCASEGLGGADANKRISQGLQPDGKPQDVAPNPWFAYHTVSGGTDGGSSLQDNIAFFQRYGCARQAVWPRSNGWRREPSDEAYEDASHYKPEEILAFPVNDTELLGTLILHGYPVYTGYSGHAWYMAWLESTTHGRWVNSWGAGWGDNGTGVIPFSRLRYGCYAVLSVSMSGLDYD